MAEVTIQGLDELYRKLSRLEDIQDVLEPPTQRAVLRLQRDMATSPPARPGSRYRRTGSYGRRWTTLVERTGTGIIGTIGNSTSYGPFVGSKQFQARVHRGRWPTDADTLDKNAPEIQRDFDAAVQRAIDE